MMALSLLVLISLNIVFLGYIKGNFLYPSDSFLFVGLSYFLVGIICAGRFKKEGFSRISNISGWAISLASIFYLYNSKSLKIFPSDIILAQMVSPYLAILWVEKKIINFRALKFSRLDLLPVLVLSTVLLLKLVDSTSEHAWSLIILLFLFLMTQINLRIISKKNLLPGLLSYGNLLVGVSLLSYLPFSNDAITLSLNIYLVVTLLLSVVLILCLETLFVKVLRELNPIVSATLISSGLPLSVFYEAIFFSRLNYAEITLSVLYVLSVGFLYIRKPLPS
ncbi:MAG: hypothetical protein K2P81_03315 [Bacteriovoracaceae bacterium]|nr:hypothetical protein [Bacteriovoracaceae bacterium]